MNNLKSGDKVICIKNRTNLKNTFLNHIEGKIYIIKDYFTLHEDGTGFENYHVTGEVHSTHFGSNIFDKYFISLKDHRKLKLDKINELRKTHNKN